MSVRSRVRLFLVGTVLLHGAAGADAAWQHAGSVRGVAVEAQPTAAGFDAHRAVTTVCTGFEPLLDYLSDASQIRNWLPYTESARQLDAGADADPHVRLFYVRTEAPWPLRPRDMIYRVYLTDAAGDIATAADLDASGKPLQMALEGVPEFLPPQPDAVRMRSAEGAWTFRREGERIRVELRLRMDPGSVPRRMANRRIRSAVGGALANLHQRFPCPAHQPETTAGPRPTGDGQGTGQRDPGSANMPPP
jgi:hypothetical protein